MNIITVKIRRKTYIECNIFICFSICNTLKFSAMKEFLTKFSRLFLPLFGVSAMISCMRDMYGCPYSDFEAKGVVTDEEGNGINGIRVVLSSEPLDTGLKVHADTLWTDGNGEYGMTSEYVAFRNEVYMKFEDVDGVENGGEFSAVEKTVPVVQVKEGDGSWYEGAYEAEADVTMTRKK